LTDLLEQGALLALVAHSRQEWSRTAALVEEAGSALAIVRGELPGDDMGDAIADLFDQVEWDEVERNAEQIQRWGASGVRLLTVLDEAYPINLREIYNRPPFLFVRGDLLPTDSRAIAVVGTRQASEQGRSQARQLAVDLSDRGVTVLSGLALGIDAAAHEGALDAGGRTVAVLGTGINRVYPPAHRDLASRILQHGAQVSQFWPDAPPTQSTFPMRNVVTSGIALGTVVVEASGKSGARLQARLCLDHGKRLFLVRSLVMHEEWAQRYAERPGATVVESVDDVVEVVDAYLNPPVQLSLY
jgi:DNA processing protein